MEEVAFEQGAEMHTELVRTTFRVVETAHLKVLRRRKNELLEHFTKALSAPGSP